MISTSTPLGSDFPKQIVNLFINAMDEGTKQAARMLWGIFISILKEHWLFIMVFLFVVFIVLTLKAMVDQWGSLGSFLYNFFYFGILFIIGLMWGPEIFVNDFFNTVCAVVLYPICYIITGLILDKVRERR
jgi:hypothetical protein